jgi:hypothetical protein
VTDTKLGQGLWLVGEFDGVSDRTVEPRRDEDGKIVGKNFTPFSTESIRLISNDETKYVEWRAGKRPPVEDLVEGESVIVPVRPGRPMADGSIRWEGRSLPILANE